MTLIEVQKEYGKKLAEKAFSLGAIKLSHEQPFQWASGYRMPIYNDNRQFLRDPSARRLIADGFAAVLEVLEVQPDWLAGTATAGIPHATTLADALKLPLAYVRSSGKDHGMKNQIEGLPHNSGFQGASVVVIEDLISTGGSSIEAVEAVVEAGATVPLCLAIFTYGLAAADENFASLQKPCKAVTLLTYDDMLTEAIQTGYIQAAAGETLSEWRRDPFAWGANHGFPRIVQG